MVSNTIRQRTAAAVASAAVVAVVAIVLGSGSISIRPSSWWRPAISSNRHPPCPELIDITSVRRDIDQNHQGYVSGPLLDWEKELDACQLFSGSYVEARQRFRDAALQLPGAIRLGTLPLPINDDSTGHESDEESTRYTIDVAVIPGTVGTGSEPRLVVVHTSGVHGVEGYAGSAVQIAFLNLLKDSIGGTGSNNSDESFERRPTVVLVHAFNPYGMAHFRRVNEHNVDLNRNGIRDFASLVSSSEASNKDAANDRRRAYEQFRNLFVPVVSHSTPFGWLWLRQWLVFAWEAIRNGVPLLKEAMVNGQYHDPSGIFYGGDQIQASYTVLEKWIVDELLPSLLAGSAMKDSPTHEPRLDVTWIDVHTGLGPSGEDTILPCLPKTQSHDATTTLSRLRERFPQSHHPSNSAAGSQVASGYNKVVGQVGDYFEETFRLVSNQASFVVQEFGTISAPRVGHALIVENAWRHRRQPQPQRSARSNTSQWLRHAFYPDDVLWRRNVVTRGLRVLLQGMLP